MSNFVEVDKFSRPGKKPDQVKKCLQSKFVMLMSANLKVDTLINMQILSSGRKKEDFEHVFSPILPSSKFKLGI